MESNQSPEGQGDKYNLHTSNGELEEQVIINKALVNELKANEKIIQDLRSELTQLKEEHQDQTRQEKEALLKQVEELKALLKQVEELKAQKPTSSQEKKVKQLTTELEKQVEDNKMPWKITCSMQSRFSDEIQAEEDLHQALQQKYQELTEEMISQGLQTLLTQLTEEKEALDLVAEQQVEELKAQLQRAETLHHSLPQPKHKTRAEFLKYSLEITMDPNTAFKELLLSEGNRRATEMGQCQCYPHHPDRFTGYRQVLSRQRLTGRCYWEVEWRGRGVAVAVSYESIRRDGGSDECAFGFNNKSQILHCDPNSYTFVYNGIRTDVSGPPSSRIGVYLDHSAGILSFYSVSVTMTLLHRVQTTFTEPLHAGLWFYRGASAEFCKLK